LSEALRILILEDQPADAELVTRELRKAGFEFTAKNVTSEKQFLAELRNAAPELILADYSLPGYDGLSALAAAQKQCPETPFIFVSGTLGEEKAIETLRHGATDYVLKDRLAPAAAAGAEVLGGKETILLVEDEHAVRMTIRRVLESKGYTVREATTAREALEVWHTHEREIALLLTDIVMPGEMTGHDLAEQLWGQRPGLKVVFMSGYSAEVLGKNTDFIRRNRSYFLQKPSTSRVILETVCRCLDEQEPVAAPGEAGGAK
jgi:CheY-like chemotaxis protein